MTVKSPVGREFMHRGERYRVTKWFYNGQFRASQEGDAPNEYYSFRTTDVDEWL